MFSFHFHSYRDRIFNYLRCNILAFRVTLFVVEKSLSKRRQKGTIMGHTMWKFLPLLVICVFQVNVILYRFQNADIIV